MHWPLQKSFAHGVHPPEEKSATCAEPIRQFPFAPLMVVPLSQHLGNAAKPVVREDEEVVRGQVIAEPDCYMSVAMHAPASGTIRKIALAPSAGGAMVPSIYLEPFAGSTQEVATGNGCEPTASPEEILEAIQWAGIVGLGGAAFPTHAKLKIPEGHLVDTIVVNGVECEPYLTTDHRVMLEQHDDIVMGIRYLLAACAAERVVIGVEANKLDAADALRKEGFGDLPVTVEVLPVKYPQGAEKMLISALLGREVPSGGLPYEVGAVCINVATTAEIGRLLPRGRGIQERIVTVTGPAIEDRGNFRIPIGTPLRFLLETVGTSEDIAQVFLGGPMMGGAVASLDVPIVKGTSGVVAFTRAEVSTMERLREYPCIRCGACLDACPLKLNPCELGQLARNARYEEMADGFHLMDCFECGSCSFVCPAHIPLVQHFRVAKTAVRKARAT